MSVEQNFLRDVQRSGWQVEAVDAHGCVARCGSPGCKVRVKLRQGAAIPQRCSSGADQAVPLTDYDTARVFLRGRREDLHLTIAEVEEVAGMTPDRLAKCERDDWSKMPNAQTFFEWAQALGYRVVLEPAALPPLMLSVIAQTRALVPSRARRTALEKERRSAAG